MEHDAHIPLHDVASRHDVPDVPPRRIPLEHRRPEDGGRLHHAVSSEGEELGCSKAQVRLTHFRLDRLSAQPMKFTACFAKKHMDDDVVEVRDGDREKDEIGQQRFGEIFSPAIRFARYRNGARPRQRARGTSA